MKVMRVGRGSENVEDGIGKQGARIIRRSAGKRMVKIFVAAVVVVMTLGILG